MSAVALAVLLLPLALLCGCSRSNDAQALALETATPAAASPKLSLVAPLAVRFRPQITATGNLKPQASAPLAMPVPGTLARVYVKRGAWVPLGAMLATLDDALARATVAQAAAGVAAAQAQLALATDALERMQKLRAEEGAAESQLVSARAQRDLASAQSDAARAQELQALVNLRYQSLRAPFAGVVIRVPDGVGFATSPAVPLFQLEATQALILETSVTQEEAPALKPGLTVTVVVPATGAKSDQATVRVVLPSVDPATNRVPVEITVPNADQRFFAHAFARAEFAAGEEQSAWSVPGASLVQREGSFAVWLAGADNIAHTSRVRLFREEGGTAIVRPGDNAWPEGARVIAAPPLGLSEGMSLAGDATP